MKLKKVIIHKYKSFENDQELDIEDDITILVGMNESGKTSALEAIAKTNYFQNDKKFKFNKTHDLPRRQKKAIDKTKETPQAVTCVYEVDEDIKKEVEDRIGEGIVTLEEITITTKYDNVNTWGGVKANFEKFIKSKINEATIDNESIYDDLMESKNIEDIDALLEQYEDEKSQELLEDLKIFFENSYKWENPLKEYLVRSFLKPHLPKFLYYDEYYALPSRIVLDDLENEELDSEDFKTAKALLELADLDVSTILEADDFEEYIAELEATEAIISDELFKYWSTNKNLGITFKIEAKEEKVQKQVRNIHNQQQIIDNHIVEHILDIRVKNSRSRVSLPLKNRSKGFNWFFSFIVWFKKIQEDKTSKYILLLDEPGLNLHASAQNDLIRFIEDLSDNYQIIYTTHSPFAIPSNKLERVRTVLETENGSVISDSIQEKDPKTLFPLQAALGYDIAQNLFISPKNLLVEGVSDLMILTVLSGILESEGRTSLRSDITIVPTGGLEKVATFISLLRGSKLEIVCLLDSFTDPKGKAKLEKLIRDKIIHKSKVRFFNEFIKDRDYADLEDLFNKEDYLKIFNPAFSDYQDIKIEDLDTNIPRIISQINKQIQKSRFNHYLPAKELVKLAVDKSFFSSDTLDNFEKVFSEMNKLFTNK